MTERDQEIVELRRQLAALSVVSITLVAPSSSGVRGFEESSPPFSLIRRQTRRVSTPHR